MSGKRVKSSPHTVAKHALVDRRWNCVPHTIIFIFQTSYALEVGNKDAKYGSRLSAPSFPVVLEHAFNSLSFMPFYEKISFLRAECSDEGIHENMQFSLGDG